MYKNMTTINIKILRKMGIKNLNRFLIDNCSKKSIKKIHLKQLENKTIVVDTSIYMYKFVSENSLLEKMYLFVSIFKKYNIKPIIANIRKNGPVCLIIIQSNFNVELPSLLLIGVLIS